MLANSTLANLARNASQAMYPRLRSCLQLALCPGFGRQFDLAFNAPATGPSMLYAGGDGGDHSASGYQEVSSSTRLDAAIGTVFISFKTTQSDSNFPAMFSRCDASSSTNGFNMYLNGGALNVQAKPSAGGAVFTFSGGSNLTSGAWRSAAVELRMASGATQVLRVDGKIVNTTTAASAWVFNSQVVRVGRSLDSFWGQFLGRTRAVYWFAGTLSQPEHMALAADPFAPIRRKAASVAASAGSALLLDRRRRMAGTT